MPTPKPELRSSPRQPTLPLEMFLEGAETYPSGSPGSGALGIPAAQSRPPLTCEPSGVWKTLEEADRERVKSSWARTMREVADDASDQ